MITFKDVLKGYNNPETKQFQPIIEINSLNIEPGSHVAVTGPSGTGKTTLLHLISGLISPEKGNITVMGTDIVTLSESKRDRFRADHIGYIFQTFNLLDGFTALENVQLGMLFSGKSISASRASDVLSEVGLENRLHYKPAQLSVGQQQRVCIARALVNDPDIILADEPTGNLDPTTSAEVLKLLKERAKDKILLVVTHENDVIKEFNNVLNIDSLTKTPASAVS